jgi:hypothetical protein
MITLLDFSNSSTSGWHYADNTGKVLSHPGRGALVNLGRQSQL